MDTEQEYALSLATEAGHILLENGAEISRVEDTIQHLASAYGVEDESFYVLSNGIIATGQHYARAEFIPIKGTQLSRVVEVNQLSREVGKGTAHAVSQHKERKIGVLLFHYDRQPPQILNGVEPAVLGCEVA